MRKTDYFNMLNVPNGQYCHIMAVSGDTAWCDFGDKHENVKLSNLTKEAKKTSHITDWQVYRAVKNGGRF